MTCALEATRRVPGSIGDRLNLRRGREVVPGLRTSRVQGGNIDVELGTGFGFTPGSDRIPGAQQKHRGRFVAQVAENGRAFPAMRWVWVDQDTDRPIGGPPRVLRRRPSAAAIGAPHPEPVVATSDGASDQGIQPDLGCSCVQR